MQGLHVKVFDDVYSLIHLAIAFLSHLLGVGLESTILYVFYQMVDRDQVEEKLGDLVEYMAGLLIGALIRATVCKSL